MKTQSMCEMSVPKLLNPLKAPSSFPLTKKITVKYFPDHPVAQKQQCQSYPQCFFHTNSEEQQFMQHFWFFFPRAW